MMRATLVEHNEHTNTTYLVERAGPPTGANPLAQALKQRIVKVVNFMMKRQLEETLVKILRERDFGQSMGGRGEGVVGSQTRILDAQRLDGTP